MNPFLHTDEILALLTWVHTSDSMHIHTNTHSLSLSLSLVFSRTLTHIRLVLARANSYTYARPHSPHTDTGTHIRQAPSRLPLPRDGDGPLHLPFSIVIKPKNHMPNAFDKILHMIAQCSQHATPSQNLHSCIAHIHVHMSLHPLHDAAYAPHSGSHPAHPRTEMQGNRACEPCRTVGGWRPNRRPKHKHTLKVQQVRINVEKHGRNVSFYYETSHRATQPRPPLCRDHIVAVMEE